MKTFFLFVVMASVGVFLGHYCEATTNQAQAIGYAALPQVTAAQALVLAISTGTVVYCPDCLANGAKGTICVSTGIAANSLVLSTGTHCQ